MLTEDDFAREAKFRAIYPLLRRIAANERPIDPEEKELYLECRGWQARMDAARDSGDVEAMRHWIDELNLLGETMLGRLLAKGYEPVED